MSSRIIVGECGEPWRVITDNMESAFNGILEAAQVIGYLHRQIINLQILLLCAPPVAKVEDDEEEYEDQDPRSMGWVGDDGRP